MGKVQFIILANLSRSMSICQRNNICELMKLGYTREAAGLPSRKMQEDALRAAGIEDFNDEGPVWHDKNPKKRKQSPGAEPLPALAEALKAMRPGDELVVANPAVLGGSRGQVFEVLQAIGKRQGAVSDASTGQAIPWSPEALAVVDFCNRAETLTRSFALAKARVRRAELGRTGGTPTKLVGKAKEAALAIWLDPALTGDQAAEKIGISPSTAYRKLGPRDQPLFGRKPRI